MADSSSRRSPPPTPPSTRSPAHMDLNPPALRDRLDPFALSLLDLPFDWLLRVVRLLHPFDLCRIATTCRSLRRAADLAWSEKVPIYPPDLFPRLSMKHISFHLRSEVRQRYRSDPAIVHGCFLMPARTLHITWGDDTRYWRWRGDYQSSWFSEVARLRMVCWLEIMGICELVFKPGRYLALFRIRLNHINGFEMQPVSLSLSTSNGQIVERQRCFQGVQRFDPMLLAPLRDLGDWQELVVGEFVVEHQMLLRVEASMLEIESGRWKSGLVVDCLMIRPT